MSRTRLLPTPAYLGPLRTTYALGRPDRLLATTFEVEGAGPSSARAVGAAGLEDNAPHLSHAASQRLRPNSGPIATARSAGSPRVSIQTVTACPR
jgi:hypothetical protein